MSPAFTTAYWNFTLHLISKSTIFVHMRTFWWFPVAERIEWSIANIAPQASWSGPTSAAFCSPCPHVPPTVAAPSVSPAALVTFTPALASQSCSCLQDLCSEYLMFARQCSKYWRQSSGKSDKNSYETFILKDRETDEKKKKHIVWQMVVSVSENNQTGNGSKVWWNCCSWEEGLR